MLSLLEKEVKEYISTYNAGASKYNRGMCDMAKAIINYMKGDKLFFHQLIGKEPGLVSIIEESAHTSIL